MLIEDYSLQAATYLLRSCTVGIGNALLPQLPSRVVQ